MAELAQPYAQTLGDRDPILVLAETQISIPAIARKLGPASLKETYAEGKWTANQILAHLADCEIAFGFRVRQILSEPQLPIQSFDENHWARRYGSMDGLQAAETFQALRGWNLALFHHLTAEDLEQAAAHPKFGQQKAATVLRILAGHTLHHLAQMETIVLKSH